MLVGLLLMAIWLGAAGDMFFKIISCGLADITHALHTPMHAVGDRMQRLEQEAEVAEVAKSAEAAEAPQLPQRPAAVSKPSAEKEATGRDQTRRKETGGGDGDGDGDEGDDASRKQLPAPAPVAKMKLMKTAKAVASSARRLVTSPILASWAVLFLVMCAGALVLREYEWETARASAVEWHAAYGEMIAEFEAHENMTGVTGSSMKKVHLLICIYMHYYLYLFTSIGIHQ
jgi:hypothetical protein